MTAVLASRPVIHIGLHKTATTTLQENLLAGHAELFAAGLPASRHDPDLVVFREALYAGERRRFEAEAFRAMLIDKAAGRRIVLSDENLSTGPLRSPALHITGGACVDRLDLAQRLKMVLPEARIVLVLREQFSYLASYYMQFQKEGVLKADFDDWLASQERHSQGAGFVNMLDYAKLVDTWAEVFGREALTVLCYEQLRHDPDGYFGTWGEVLGLAPETVRTAYAVAERNPRVTRAEIALRPLFVRYPGLRNGLKAAVPGNLVRSLRGRLPQQNVQVDALTRDRLSRAFALGNTQLAAEWGLALDTYGYRCG